jgi:hypothetical protein
MRKLIVGGIVIVLGICLGSFKVATNMVDANSGKNKAPIENVVKSKVVEAKTPSVLGNQKVEVATRIEIVTRIHEMANTLILAEDNKIWGTVAVNKDTVVELLNMINTSKAFDEKDTFIAIAKKWKNSDFTNIVADHNLVWKILEGTIGKADEPNVPAVAEAKEILK